MPAEPVPDGVHVEAAHHPAAHDIELLPENLPRALADALRAGGQIGSDVLTAPFKVLMQLLDHPLTKTGLDKFLADWEKSKKAPVPPVSPSDRKKQWE